MRSSKTSDAKLIGLFLDMLGAEQGAGINTLDAYRRDLTDFSEFLARAGQSFAGADRCGSFRHLNAQAPQELRRSATYTTPADTVARDSCKEAANMLVVVASNPAIPYDFNG